MGRPFVHRAHQPVFHDSSLQKRPDQLQHPLVANALGDLSQEPVVINPMVGRDGSCDCVACARPPSQNPPSRFPATGSPGCSRWRVVKPWHGGSTPHTVVRTRIASVDRTSRAGAADSVVSTYGPIAAVPRPGPRQASACSDAIRNTGRSRAASSRVAFAKLLRCLTIDTARTPPIHLLPGFREELRCEQMRQRCEA